MNTRFGLLFVRFVYWLGVLLDAGAAILLMFPSLNARFSGWDSFDLSAAFVSTTGTAAALMWGWTALLAWGSHRPVERRALLLLTAVPVLVGMITTRVLEARSAGGLWPSNFVQPVLFILFLAAFFIAGHLRQTSQAGTALTV